MVVGREGQRVTREDLRSKCYTYTYQDGIVWAEFNHGTWWFHEKDGSIYAFSMLTLPEVLERVKAGTMIEVQPVMWMEEFIDEGL